MNARKVREVLGSSLEPVSIETPIGDEEDSVLGDFIADESVETPEAIFIKKTLKEEIDRALKILTPREESVIRCRFGLDSGTPLTLDEVGKKFDITRERIRQIESKALFKLRKSKVFKGLKESYLLAAN